MLNKTELTLNTTERKLLWGIYETLQEINSRLRPATAEQTGADLDSLSRKELMALVKELEVKPEGWTRLGNQDLIKILKEGA